MSEPRDHARDRRPHGADRACLRGTKQFRIGDLRAVHAGGTNTRGTVRIATDACRSTTPLTSSVSPKEPLRIIIAERPGATRAASLYLSRALAARRYAAVRYRDQIDDAVSTDDCNARRCHPQRRAGRAVDGGTARHVRRPGRGLLIALGNGPRGRPHRRRAVDILPATPGQPSTVPGGQAARLGALEYGHPIFEPFRAPRSGDFSCARFYSYRAVTLEKRRRSLRGSMMARRRSSSGASETAACSRGLRRSICRNDLALKSVFLPFVHRVGRRSHPYSERPSWLTVGDVLDAARHGPGAWSRAAGDTACSADAVRRARDARWRRARRPRAFRAGLLRSARAGRRRGSADDRGEQYRSGESDLTPMDPQEVVAGAMGRAGGAASAGECRPPPIRSRSAASACGESRDGELQPVVVFAPA